MGLFSTGNSDVDAAQLGLTGLFTSVANKAVSKLLPGGGLSNDARATAANPPVQGGVTKAPTALPGTVSQAASFFNRPIVIIGAVVAVLVLGWALLRKRR